MGDFDTRAKLGAALGREPPITAGGQYRRGPVGSSTPVTKTADGFAAAPLGREQTEDGRQFVSRERAVWIIFSRLCACKRSKLPELKKAFEAVHIVSGPEWREVLQREYPKTWANRLNIQGFSETQFNDIWINRERTGGSTLIHELVDRLQEDTWLGQSRPLSEGIAELFVRKFAGWHNEGAKPRDKMVFDEGTFFHHYNIALWLEKLAGEMVLAGSFFGGDIQPVKTALNRSTWVQAQGGYNWFLQQTKSANRSDWESLIATLKKAVTSDHAGPQKSAGQGKPGQGKPDQGKPGQRKPGETASGHAGLGRTKPGQTGPRE